MSVPYGRNYSDTDQAANEDGTVDKSLLSGFAISGDFSAVHETYLRWFGADYDLGALDAVLCAAAAERLQGDPAWILVVGGSGAAKTETIMPLTGAGAHVVSTLTGQAALLSGTPRKEQGEGATGGLLRKIGNRGLMVIKDVTSIISMSRDSRAEVLAALREVYDGSWTRNIGADGGYDLVWNGRIVIVGGVTTAWDSAHQVIAAMGDRFVLVRLNSKEHRKTAGRQAMRNVNHETDMRHELSTVVGKLLDTVTDDATIELTDAESDKLLDLADLVTQARTAVERSFQGDPLFAHDPEMPTRFAKQLSQIARGGIALGMNRGDAVSVAMRCAGDSMPPLRLSVLADVAAHPVSLTADVVKRLQVPRSTVDRTLQELHLLGLLKLGERETASGQGVRWVYSLAPDVNPDDLERLTRNGETQAQEGSR